MLSKWVLIYLVTAQGFEPRTSASVVRCSIQLSYAAKIGCKYKNSLLNNRRPLLQINVWMRWFDLPASFVPV